METAPNTAWRVWTHTPEGSRCDQFPERRAAHHYAATVRDKHPDWDVEIVEWNIPGSAR